MRDCLQLSSLIRLLRTDGFKIRILSDPIWTKWVDPLASPPIVGWAGGPNKEPIISQASKPSPSYSFSYKFRDITYF